MASDPLHKSQPPGASAKIRAVLHSPCTSHWLATSLKSADLRDPVDAVNDASLLLALLQARLDEHNARMQELVRSRAGPSS
jgi:hypothetical protein